MNFIGIEPWLLFYDNWVGFVNKENGNCGWVRGEKHCSCWEVE